MLRVVTINGILTHGEGNVDVLGRILAVRGYEVKDPWHYKVNPLTARWRGPQIAQQLAKWIEPGDILIAHSFGCHIARHLLHMIDVQCAGVYLIAAADDRDADWTNAKVDRITCYHSPDDWVVWLGSMLLLHPFGAAGTKGYTDPRVKNRKKRSDHDDYFKAPLSRKIVDEICLFHPTGMAPDSDRDDDRLRESGGAQRLGGPAEPAP